MLGLTNRLLSKVGLEVRRIPFKYPSGIAASLVPDSKAVGRVLISYIPDAVLSTDDEVSAEHTHYWECRHIARSFFGRGFAVDVVHFADRRFAPRHEYDVLISARTNLERLARHMPSHCLKIAHLDTAHFLTHNANALRRLADIRDRHRVTLRNNRLVEDNWAIEAADIGCVLGNDFTAESYRFAGKPIHKIPLSSVRKFDWDDAKDFRTCRDTFIWFGSGGFAHKGLNLVIDAFQDISELKLVICGPLDAEPRFTRAFDRQMFHTDNIETIGWIDVTSQAFADLSRRTLATIYPSCSEGGGGSVITCMHAGLIPIVTKEASIEVEDFGIVLEAASVGEIRKAVLQLSQTSAEELRGRARSAWKYARNHHTREIFAEHYDRFVEDVVLPEVEKRRSATTG